jgi:hypothetical protein
VVHRYDSGNWSTPGTLTFLGWSHDPKGWSDMAVYETCVGYGYVA